MVSLLLITVIMGVSARQAAAQTCSCPGVTFDSVILTGENLVLNVHLDGPDETISGFGSLCGGVLGSFDSNSISAIGGELIIDGGPCNSFGTFSTPWGLIDAGTDQLVIRSDGDVFLGDLITLSGGTLSIQLSADQPAGNRLQLGFDEEIRGFGTIEGSFIGAAGALITVTGPLTFDTATASASQFMHSGTLDVGAAALTIETTTSRAVLTASSSTTLLGGILRADNGFSFNSGMEIRGEGTIRSAAAPFSGVITVGDIIAEGSGIVFDTLLDRTNGGGDIRGTRFRFTGNGGFEGEGLIDAEVFGDPGSTITARDGGPLTMGEPTSTDGFETLGTLDVGFHQVELLDADFAELGSSTILTNGTLTADNGVRLGPSDTLTGHGTVDAPLRGLFGCTITPDELLVLGRATAPDGIDFDGQLNVGAETVELRDQDEVEIGGDVSIAGGTMRGGPSGVTAIHLHPTGSIEGNGLVRCSFIGDAGSSITADGELTIGHPAESGGYDHQGTLSVGSHHVILDDADEALLGSSTTLANGVLEACNGMRIDGADQITGFGFVIGPVSGTNFPNGMTIATNPTGTATLDTDLSLCADSAVYSNNLTLISTSLDLNGFALEAPNGIKFLSNTQFASRGRIDGKVTGEVLSTIAATGTLTLGDSTLTAGVFHLGTLEVGNRLVTLESSNSAVLTTVNIAGGTIDTANGFRLFGNGGNLTGFGTVNGSFLGDDTSISESEVNAIGGTLTIGDGSRTDGVVIKGSVTVDNATLVIRDANGAVFGPTTTLTNGVIFARNGIALTSDFPNPGDQIFGHGIIIGDVSGNSLGLFSISTNPTGTVSYDGAMDVGSHTARAYSQLFTTLTGPVSLSGGAIIAPNGLSIVGSSLTGFGLIEGKFHVGASIMELTGNMQVGDSATTQGVRIFGDLDIGSHTLTLLDADSVTLGAGNNTGVTTMNGGTILAPNGMLLNVATLIGSGTVDTGQFTNNGFVEPGLPTGILSMTEDYEQINTAELRIEIGGTTPGSGYDRLAVGGLAELSSILTVSLINGFTPAHDDTFDILTAGAGVSGTFSTVNLPALPFSLEWEISYGSGVVQLRVNDPFEVAIVERGWRLTRCLEFDDAISARLNPVDEALYVGRRTGATRGLYRIDADDTTTAIWTGDDIAAVLIDPVDGDIFATDDFSGEIYRTPFGQTGRETWVAGFHANDDDPIGMAIAPADYIGNVLLPGEAIVVDRGNNGLDEIWRWSPDVPEGETVVHVDDGTLIDAVDVTITAQSVYVVDRAGSSPGVIYDVADDGTLTALILSESILRPSGIVVDPLTGDLYVIDNGDGTGDDGRLLRVRPDDGAVTEVVTGLDLSTGEFAGVDVSPDGRTLVVTSLALGKIYVFTLGPDIVESGWTVQRIITANSPVAARYNPVDDRIYVGRRFGTDKGLYRVESDNSVTPIWSGDHVAGVLVDPQAGDVYTTDDFSGEIFRVPFGQTTREVWVAGLHSGDDDPIGMALAPPDYFGEVLFPGEALVVDRGSSGLDEIWRWSPDAPEGETVVHADDGTLVNAVDVAISDQTVYVVDPAGSISGVIYEVAADGTLTPLATSEPIEEPSGITVDPITGDLFVLDGGVAGGGARVVRVDPINGVVSDMFVGFDMSNDILAWAGIDITPGGNRIVVTDGSAGRIYVLGRILPCDDSDGDGVCDADDVCPGGDDTLDSDGDGFPDHCDGFADFDHTGIVDLIDYSALADCVSGPGNTPTPTPPATADECLESFDSDSDGDVDLLDVAEFQIVFNP